MIKQVLRAEWFNQLPEALAGGIWSYQSTMGPGGGEGGVRREKSAMVWRLQWLCVGEPS